MLSNSKLYSTWRARLVQLAPDECASRLSNMLYLIVGLYQAGSVHLSKIARKLPIRAKKMSIDKRLRRFLDNGGIRVREWYRPIAEGLVQAAASGGSAQLLIDTTKVGFGWQMLMVGIAYRRRALPLAWTWVRGKRGHSSARIQLALLRYLHALLPAGIKVSLAGDCEFKSMDLVAQLAAWGWDYTLRQPSHQVFKPQAGTWQRLDHFPLQAGDLVWLGRVMLTGSHRYVTNLVLYWKPGEPAPWYLATNLPSPHGALRLYRRRMWLEEMFGDLKGHGFDLESTHLRHFLRLSRLTLALCLLYLWLVATGDQVIAAHLTDEVDRSDRRDLSIFRLGWDFIERRLALDDPIPFAFIPNICLVSGS
jgi:Transposase DDE domain